MKKPLLFTLFFACAPVLLAARVLQQFYMIDPVTGFYLDGFAGVGTVITVASIALIPVLLLTVWLSRPDEVVPAKRSRALGVAAFFAALCLVLSGVFGAITAKNGGQTAVAILSFTTAIAFAWHGVCVFTGAQYNGVMSLVGILYGLMRLILTFMGYTGEVTVTDTVFDIATMCLLLLFLYSSGKILSGVSGPRTPVLFYAYGLAAAFFCVDSFLAQTVAVLTKTTASLHGGHFDMSYIGFAVYMVVMICVYSKPSADDNKDMTQVITQTEDINT